MQSNHEKKLEIYRIISENLVSDITEENSNRTFEELGIHSILLVKIVVQIEISLGISLEDDMMINTEYSNISDFVEYILSLYNSRE